MNKDLITVFLVDGIALLITLYTGLTSAFMLKEKNKSNTFLKIMLTIIFYSTILDALSYVFDTKYEVFSASNATLFNDIMIYLTCSLIRIGLVTGLICFNLYFSYRLKGYVDRIRLYMAYIITTVSVILLIVNIFTPIVFDVTDHSFSRGGFGYFLFYIFALILLIDTFGFYIYVRLKGGLLKFFPVWFFLLPMVVAAIVQYFLPDISTIWIGAALTVDFLFMALQNDTLYRDRLTKLYNRLFLDLLKNVMEKASRSRDFTAMMLDLNGFKLINDNFGHSVGDEALVVTGDLLREAVGPYGAVIRFAGDEFIVILNTQNDAMINKIVKNINDIFDNFNKQKKAQYELSISLGYSKVDLKNSSIDEVMKDIDEKMYLDKQEKHKAHPEWDRK
ncbi:MAG: GGDEF domain-containing protein [Acholeplasmatales bacterium]|nr:GGDEF domain-containing protein [Acholeplasmatales bacterium]